MTEISARRQLETELRKERLARQALEKHLNKKSLLTSIPEVDEVKLVSRFGRCGIKTRVITPSVVCAVGWPKACF